MELFELSFQLVVLILKSRLEDCNDLQISQILKRLYSYGKIADLVVRVLEGIIKPMEFLLSVFLVLVDNIIGLLSLN